jgi:hypothetical protein
MKTAYRIPLIIAGLVLPVIVLATLAPYLNNRNAPSEKKPMANEAARLWVPLKENTTNMPASVPPLDGKHKAEPLTRPLGIAPAPTDHGTEDIFESERERVRLRLEKLEAMTKEDFAEDQKNKPTPPGEKPLTLGRARMRTANRLAQLNAMTPQQWADEQRQKFKAGTDLEKLTPQQKEAMQKEIELEEAAKAKKN